MKRFLCVDGPVEIAARTAAFLIVLGIVAYSANPLLLMPFTGVSPDKLQAAINALPGVVGQAMQTLHI